MNVKSITDNLLCSGCGTCNSICVKNAITMKKTPTMGLLYADIDVDKCSDCGLCLKVCPSSQIMDEKDNVTSEKILGDVRNCYIGRTTQRNFFNNAQSGGLVTAILADLFDNGLIDAAITCRMEYGYPLPCVHYSILTSSVELSLNQKSCYTQVDIVSALKETQQFKSIAIVGLPCHIQGVSNMLIKKRFCNIKYRIGLICDKTYTDTYMNAILYGEKVPNGPIRINYRQKNFIKNGTYYSYEQAPTVILNKNDDMLIVPNVKRMFLKEYFVVPKCKICWDKLNIHADIVLGDPWRINGKYDKKEGDSLVVVRSNLGEQILLDLAKSKKIILSEISVEEVANSQLIYNRVNEIRNYDFVKKVLTWRSYENKKKNQILKDTRVSYIKYKIIQKFDFVKKVIYKLKMFVS